MALIVTLVGLISSVIGIFLAPRQSRRVVWCRNVWRGSAAALVSLFGLSVVYDLITFIPISGFIMLATGGRLVDAFLPAGWLYGRGQRGERFSRWGRRLRRHCRISD